MNAPSSRPVAAVYDRREERRRVLVGGHRPPLQQAAAFTLLELLVVIGLIATLAAFLLGGLGGGDQAAALPSAQASVVNMVTAARQQATATGRKTRLLVNVDPSAPDRFLRYIVWQRAREAGASPVNWDVVETINLPPGCYVVPGSLRVALGLVENEADWRLHSAPAQSLVSSLFANQTLTLALPGDVSAQAWTGVAFTAPGTLAALAGGPPPTGNWLVATGTVRAPGSYAMGEAPVRLQSPRTVRGLILSAYGVPTVVSEPDAL